MSILKILVQQGQCNQLIKIAQFIFFFFLYFIKSDIVRIKMLETTSNISVNENKSQAHLKKQQSFTLPNIHKKKIVSQPRSESQFDQKDQLSLPHIFNKKKQQQIYSLRNNKQIDGTFMDFSAMKQKNKDLFAREVRQKLGLVLGQIPQLGSNRENQQEYSQDSDFEAKINKNKELIKQHRIRRENQQENKSGEKRKKIKQQNPRKLTKMRNQSLYQKRVKDYRNQSIENKYLQKRKQVISDKQKQKEKLIHFIRQNYNQKSVETSPYKQSKNKNQYNSIKKYNNDKNYKIQPNKSQSKKNSPTSISYKEQAKSINNVSKTVTLFDGIQNFLENPRNQLKQGGKQLVGLTLLKVKRDIEDKIKNINQKLGAVENEPTPKKLQLKSLQMGATTLNWQRIQIKGEKVDFHHSSFDKELQRINSLQERNSLCLQKFLEHQKILLELQFRKRELPRMAHTNSH